MSNVLAGEGSAYRFPLDFLSSTYSSPSLPPPPRVFRHAGNQETGKRGGKEGEGSGANRETYCWEKEATTIFLLTSFPVQTSLLPLLLLRCSVMQVTRQVRKEGREKEEEGIGVDEMKVQEEEGNGVEKEEEE